MSKPRPDADPAGASAVRQAMGFFLGWSLVALAVLVVGTFVAAHSLTVEVAAREAQLGGETFGRTVAAPLVDSGLRTGSRQARAVLDTAMRDRLAEGLIVHIRIWNESGTVIWSDEPELVGRSFPVAPEIQRLFGTSDVVSHLADPDEYAGLQDSGEGRLLEVNLGARDKEGVPFVFESYWAMDSFDGTGAVVLRRLLPLGLGALLLFELAIMPLAFSLARRVDRARTDRSAILRHALSASELERRRIARDLHDGLVQDLSGLGYALPSVSASLPPDAHGARDVLDQAVLVIHRDVSALRSLLTEVYPADLAEDGLVGAVDELADQAARSGVQVDVELQVEAFSPSLPLPLTQLTYQVIREGLRNVVQHAGATRATVSARKDGSQVVVTVADNGHGFKEVTSTAGHFGLRVLEDTLSDVGGRLELVGRSGGGVALTARFPALLVDSMVR